MRGDDMIDAYSKIVLTVIAAALCALVIQNVAGPAGAVGTSCGGYFDPCYVTIKP